MIRGREDRLTFMNFFSFRWKRHSFGQMKSTTAFHSCVDATFASPPQRQRPVTEED